MRLRLPVVLAALIIVATCFFLLTFSRDANWRRIEAKKAAKRGAALNVNITEHLSAFKHIHSMLFFIGYPRSCSTLLGTLLDAHPHVVLAHEYNFFHVWPHLTDYAQKYNRPYIYSKLLGNSLLASSSMGKRHEIRGESALLYHVPNQWNGRYNKTIKVMGDKQAGSTTQALTSKDSSTWVEELERAVHVPIRFIHVIRNPYDNIATIAIRALGTRKRIIEGKVLDDVNLLNKKIDYYFRLVEKSNEIRFLYTVLDIHSIDLLSDPKTTLLRVCHYLNIECSENYLRDCASLLFSKPSHSRNNVKWNQALIDKVRRKMRQLSFLDRYTFDSN